MEYTKGEWEVKPYKATVFKGQAALSCFEVWAGERRIASTINEANAHLIAQAPRLYEACKEMLQELQQTPGVSQRFLDKWRQSIAKGGRNGKQTLP